MNQLNRILEVAGFPSPNLMSQVNEDARIYLERNSTRPPRVNFDEYFHEIHVKSPAGKILLLVKLLLNNSKI